MHLPFRRSSRVSSLVVIAIGSKKRKEKQTHLIEKS